MTTPITQLGAAELATMIADGQFSAREVIDAHIARIEEVNARLNAVCVPLFAQARTAADEVDRQLVAGNSPGPLAGVPITIKECFDVAGTAATMGLTTRVDETATSDAPLVTRLKSAGAIVLGKTNVPQLMVLHETDNPLYGRTLNPYDESRTCGGSSGGEAAIIAAGGSPLGLGSDLGGSIRIPAHFCGIHGLKPTSVRLTRRGSLGNFRGMQAIQFQPGPLARKVEDLDLAMSVFCRDNAPAQARSGLHSTSRHHPLASTRGERQVIDPSEPPIPWPDYRQINVADLRIGFWNDDQFVTPSPAIRTAVDRAARELQSAGAKIEAFEPPDILQALRLYFGVMSADGGRDLGQRIRGSRRHPLVTRMLRIGRLPRWLRPAASWMLKTGGEKTLAKIVNFAGARSAAGYWSLTEQVVSYRLAFLDQMRNSNLDALICPPHALAALPHGLGGIDLMAAASYAFLPNLLGTPCGVVSTAKVSPGSESDRPKTRDTINRLCRKVEAGSNGLPVGVQVIAPHWREDVVLAVMSAIEAACPRPEWVPKES